MKTLGHDRLIWGSDFPISHQRGCCVAIGDQFLWLYEDTLNWNTVAKHTQIQPILIGLKSLRALKLAAQRLRLTDAQVEDILFTATQETCWDCPDKASSHQGRFLARNLSSFKQNNSEQLTTNHVRLLRDSKFRQNQW